MRVRERGQVRGEESGGGDESGAGRDGVSVKWDGSGAGEGRGVSQMGR